ncbi:cytochrome b/b6 domain-containing protein [Acidimangrovimonas sediminis]|uniref:cytochrome b/b6 domain-containing protein n=1 Tax=Acidimangrovimonas sediminis TaxID=2056283 RepID=UPI0018ED2AE8|nr:cytochrome b/b6 domain-containing protein [Acidimangrovimonas sediminis]
MIRRHGPWTRITHWLWAVCLFFLLLSGLQIFDAHPALYLGQQSGMAQGFDNAVLRIGTEGGQGAAPLRGVTQVFGHDLDTTGVLGLSGPKDARQPRAFPGWATIPSGQDLATGRVVHFFFAWALVGTLAVWAVASGLNGHLRRDILPGRRDLRGLGADIRAHLGGPLPHGRRYSPLQKLAYFIVLAGLFPLMILTGLTMSPGMDAAWPWLLDLFGGRQTARSLHFLGMALIVAFFVVHIVMVLAAGPLNEMRSILTGRYRIRSQPDATEEE